MKMIPGKQKGYDRQMAAGYIAYMMGGSYFHRCRCRNRGEISRLYLHYAEMPREQQYRQEERVIRFLDSLSPKYLNYWSGLDCEVRCSRRDNDYVVEFLTGGFYSFKCVVRKDGTLCIIPFAG